MGGPWRHRISNRDFTTSPPVGDCTTCGPRAPLTRSENAKWHCLNARRERDRKRRDERKARNDQYVPGSKSKDVSRQDLKEACEVCTYVALHPCQLQIDHRDGDPLNNAPENRWTLCMGCHKLKGQIARTLRKENPDWPREDTELGAIEELQTLAKEQSDKRFAEYLAIVEEALAERDACMRARIRAELEAEMSAQVLMRSAPERKKASQGLPRPKTREPLEGVAQASA